MKAIRLLYLSARQMSAYRWQAGELTGEGIFPASADGYQEFAGYLERHEASVFTLLANVAEEGFQIETIPFLHGADRQAVIARKLGQLFFNSALTASMSLGHEKGQRKDERVMLAALTNKELFAPWLAAIADQRIALAGIHSLPLVAPALLRKLGISGAPCLLLSVQDQSVRQSYFENGELYFSRLTPLQDSSISGVAYALSAEAQKLQQYLASQRMIARDQSITAYVLAHPGALKTITGSCADTATIHYEFLDIGQCAKVTGLRSAPTDSQCVPLFLNLLVGSPPRIQFADDLLRHDHHLRQIRSALLGLGAAALLCCLLFCGKLMFETHAVNEQTGALKSEIELANRRYNDIVKTFPPIQTDHETLRRIIDHYAVLEKQNTSPDVLYRAISHALAAAPAAELESIDWQLGGIGAAQTPGAASVPGNSESVIVRGTLRLGANAGAREMLAAFNVLLAALKANPALQVAVLQRPFDIESAKSLKGDDITIENGTPRSFSVQVSRRLGS